MAAYNPKQLGQSQPATSAGTIYTVPASTTTIVTQIVIANTTTSSAWVSIRIVPSGGTSNAATSIAEQISVNPNSTQTLDLSTVMATGGFISALQQTTSAITLTISGIEVV